MPEGHFACGSIPLCAIIDWVGSSCFAGYGDYVGVSNVSWQFDWRPLSRILSFVKFPDNVGMHPHDAWHSVTSWAYLSQGLITSHLLWQFLGELEYKEASHWSAQLTRYTVI